MDFVYKAKDTFGKTINGWLQAASVEQAQQALRRDGLQILELEEDAGMGLFPRRVSRRNIIDLTSQLAVMVDTGITLAAALSGIAEQEENPSLRKLLLDLCRRVEGGEDFSVALARYPKQFDTTFIALIRASEQTGTMGEVLEQISTYQSDELATRNKVKAALAYPMVMAFLAVAVTIFLLTFVMPKFTPIFERQGTNLPTPTLFMMAISDALTGYWWAWLLGLVGLIAGFIYGRRTKTGRQILDGIKINSPIIGPLFRKVALSRSVRTLGAMVASGVSMLEAIKLSGEVAGNYYFTQAWMKVHEEITQGSRISDSLKNNSLFPHTLLQMISAGEETARLDEVLQKVSSRYDDEVSTAIKSATSMIEPLLITVMGAVVGTIGLALLLPIFSLSRGGG
jgi:type IV pilus assembly protein PilC